MMDRTADGRSIRMLTLIDERTRECLAIHIARRLKHGDVQTLFIEPGSPWENGYIESFNGRLRDELLAREQFDTLLEAKVLIERWRRRNEVSWLGWSTDTGSITGGRSGGLSEVINEATQWLATREQTMLAEDDVSKSNEDLSAA